MSTEIVSADKETTEIKERLQNNTLAEYWENADDFERLSDATIKTMRYINDEQIAQFAKSLNQTNEKILSSTFEGVKRRHKKELDDIGKKYKIRIVLIFFIGVIVGGFAVWLFFSLRGGD
ncbi:MAG: hypothetical protein LUC34_01200 [Campylobacter sp.]|nr:hypothetical protein [Campylobacter sp.]